MAEAERITVCHVLEATAGGTRQHLMDVCLGLPRERFAQTAIVSLCRDSSFEEDVARLREAGVAVEIVDMVREIDLRADTRALRRLREYFQRHPFDVIHAHSSKAGALARVASRLARNPALRVYSPHAFAFTMDISPARRRLYICVERILGRITDLLVCTCESEREIALRHRIVPAGRAAVVRTGVDLRRFHPQTEGHRTREELQIPRRHRLVGAVGAVVEQKGHAVLVEALPRVLEEMPHTTVIVVGDGPLREPLQERATELGLGRRMRFVGHRDDVPRILNALDLFVLPSRWEGMPYALVEAMAVGVPVVGSEIPGVTDVIVPGETGWLAPAGNPVGLAAAIVRALTDEGASAQMAQAAREMTMRQFSRERMLQTLGGVYERLVEDRSR